MDDLRILILGLDTFARKNVQQIAALGPRGCRFDIVTNDQRGDSRETLGAIPEHRGQLFVSQGSLLSRAWLAWRVISRNRYDLVELYPAGRMALFYLVILMLTRQRFMVIERGDIGLLHEHPPLARFAIKAAYRLAAAVLYKETYMKDLLEGLTRAPLHFVPNCIGLPEDASFAPFDERPIDFLWVNRIVPQRRPAWLIRAMRTAKLNIKRLVLLGIEQRENLPEHLRVEQETVLGDRPPNAEFHGFVDPGPYYDQARFFCLPAAVVFGNNALLEAMARGVVPVVTQAPGVELMVENGVNGIVTAFDQSAYEDGLAEAAALSAEEWTQMSAAALATVRGRYSVEAWTDKMLETYRSTLT